jgi:hypothetical protein
MDGFSWNLIFEDFSNICPEISSFIKIRREYRVLYLRPIYIFIISRSFLLRMRTVPDKSCRENQNTHFVFSNFFVENRAVYEIMWKNTVEPDRPQMAIWRMRIVWWIPKATNTQRYRLCNTHCFSIATMVAKTRLTVTLYVNCPSF